MGLLELNEDKIKKFYLPYNVYVSFSFVYAKVVVKYNT